MNKDSCPLIKRACGFLVYDNDRGHICGFASGKELTNGFGIIRNLKQCPLFVPSNFKKRSGKDKAIMRKKLWLKRIENESQI